MNALALANNQNSLVNQNNEIINIDNSVSVLNQRWQTINNNLRMTNSIMVQINNISENVDKSMESAEKQSSSFLSKVKEIGKSIFSLSNAKLAFNATIGGAAKAQEQLIGFQNLMGDKAVGKEYYDKITKESIKLGFSPDDAVKNTKSFMSVTRNTNKLDKLNNMSQLLAITNPEKGVGEAGSAIKNAMIGKFDDLQTKFNFSVDDTDVLKKSKDLADFIGNLDNMISKKGIKTQDLIDFSNTPMAQVNQLKSNIDDALSGAGEGALNALLPILTKINEAFSDGSFTNILNGITVGLFIIAQVFTFLFGLISPFIDMAINGFNFICSLIGGLGTLFLQLLPIILAVITVWALYNSYMVVSAINTIFLTTVQGIASFFTTAWAMAMNFLNIIMSLNPAVILVLAFIALGVAIATIATITNGVRKALADAFGFIVDLAQGVVNSVLSILNGAIRGINKVSGFFANILGIQSKQIQEIEFKADFSKFKNDSKDFIENATFDDVKSKIGIDKILNKKDTELNGKDTALIMENYNNKQSDTFKMPTTPAMPKPPSTPTDNIQNNLNNTNQKLDNINDSIDVSNEHLEMLKDLAEIESVQNFVTLTPTVQVTTGDIKEEADINTIISKIENYMRTELVNSAEGVYV